MENKKNMNIILAIVICLAVAGVLIFISIRNKTSMTSNVVNNTNSETPIDVSKITATNPEKTEAPAASPENTTQTGEIAKTGDTVAMNYTGRLADGTVFDSNVDPKFNHVQPFEFKLGSGQVIAGWDKGIIGMKVGEKKTLVIPPADGYGAAGHPPVIPQNATLTFDVQLLAIKK